MSEQRPPHRDGRDWEPTSPLPMTILPEPPAAPRPQPPLTEVIQGLDSRELEGETVFDQLFGNQPAAQDATRRG